MKYFVYTTAMADEDIASITEWARRRSPGSVAKWYGKLMRAIESLEHLPERCGQAEEAKDLKRDIRELSFGKRRGALRILFEIRPNQQVRVIQVRRASRDYLKPGDLN